MVNRSPLHAFKTGDDEDVKPESYHSSGSERVKQKKVVERMMEDQQRRRESKESNERLRVQLELSQLRVANSSRGHKKSSFEDFYKKEQEFKERVETDAEIKRFMGEIELKKQQKHVPISKRSN